jgi:phosphoserine/homoserine phosphotransferase
LEIICLDLEGVLLPEIWINFSEATGIKELRLTTRDIPVYDDLMKGRLKILKERGLGLREIQAVIATMEPLEGARAFLDQLRDKFQVLILSDTFYEFAAPLMRKLGSPTLFCHTLEVGDNGSIDAYRIRQADSKRQAVRAIKGLNFPVIAAGDSYNDTTMLAEADAGILFRAPQNVIAEFPQFPQTSTYGELMVQIERSAASLRASKKH